MKTLKLQYNMTITNTITIPQDIQSAPYDVTVSLLIFTAVDQSPLAQPLQPQWTYSITFFSLRLLGTRHTHVVWKLRSQGCMHLKQHKRSQPNCNSNQKKSVFTIKTIFQGKTREENKLLQQTKEFKLQSTFLEVSSGQP